MRIATIDYSSEAVWPGQNCDVLYVEGSPFSEHPRWSPWPALFENLRLHSLYDIDKTSPEEFRVITGGEPFLQGVELFVKKLKRAINCPVRIDTDGAFPGRLKLAARSGIFDHVALRIWAPIGKYNSTGLLPKGVINDSLTALEQFPSHEIIIPYDPDNVDLKQTYESIKGYDIEQITVWPLDMTVDRTTLKQSTLTRDDIISDIRNKLPNNGRIVIL